MPFCPSCRSEYQAGTTVCRECETPLVSRLEPGSTADTVDVYVCYAATDADRLALLLTDEGFAVLVRDRGSSAFPTTVGKTAQKVIAVPPEQASRARNLIEMAREDGVVTSDGDFATS